MAAGPHDADPSLTTIAARRVLLDGLTALEEHRAALVLVGAQAVYLRSGTTDLGVAAATTDADITIDPALLEADPRLEEAMSGAGFTRSTRTRQTQPGTWWRQVEIRGRTISVAIDLMAPDALTGGRRAADLPPHEKGAVRRVSGIEVAVDDHTAMQIGSLEPGTDDRGCRIEVAGVPALLVAKAFKIRDRRGTGRLSDKDAADVYRLMISSDAYEVGDSLRSLAASSRVGGVASEGLRLLRDQFGVPRGIGVEMATRALGGLAHVRHVAPAFIAGLG